MRALKIHENITERDNQALRYYFNELKQIRLLTPDEEYELAVLATNGDEKAKNLLIKHNLRFVVSVAKQYLNGNVKLSDLINEGNLGLVIAAEKFDPTKGFKFLSYAVWWVRRNMISYITDQSKTIRLPNNKSTLLFKLKQEYNTLEQQLEREPDELEFQEFLEGKYTEEEISFFIETNLNHTVSLDEEIGNESFKLNDILYNDELSVESLIDSSMDSYIRVNKMLSTLNSELERKVMMLLYGLDGNEPLSLKTVGFLLGLSSERVRQIRDISLKKLKVRLKRNKNLMV